MLWQIALVLMVVWFVVLRWKTRKLRKAVSLLNSDLSRYPLIGHAHHFTGSGENRMLVLQSILRKGINTDGWSLLDLGTEYLAVCSDAVDAEYVMRVHLEKNDILKLSANLIGNGLIFAPGHIWRPRRKVLAPTFSQHNLNQFVNIFYKQSSIMGDNLSKQVNNGTFSIWRYVTSYTMDSICETTLGTNIGVQNKSDHKFLHYFQTYAELTAKRIFYPWLHNSTSFKYLSYFGMYTRITEAINYLQGFVMNIIEKKREELKVKNTPSNIIEKRFKPIMELLIEASGGENGYTNNELQEEALVIVVAGTDTSAVGAAFVLMMLAKYPEVQEKVYKEIHALFGDSDRPMTAEDLAHLGYLEVVIKETLRLYPPVPITARKILKDDVMPSGRKLVAGMGVLIGHWGIHHNPKYWGKDVEEFRPERFFDSPPTHPGAYVPFASGSRNCLGYKYAMMSMITATTTLLRRYQILPGDEYELDKDIRLKYDVMMKHSDDYKVKLVPRR